MEASFRQYCFYIFLFLGSEGVAMAQCPPLSTLVIAVVSECLCHLRAQYPVQLPDICSG